MKAKVNQTELELTQDDITEMDTEAIVNAANASLILGGGVAGAVRTKGGPSIQEECDKIGGTYVGGAVVTGGGDLKAKYVIHAVGPRMGEGDEDHKLEQATLNSLKRADEKGMKSIAFPAISTGIFGFPVDRAAKIMLGAVKGYLERQTTLDKVVFCLYGQESFDVFAAEFRRLFSD
ncbi:MAG: macro domain-containing protein [Deltaproteobacteria bacterium]|nr:macro domain-containing protein [Deltaproteobacteria bacterium]MBW2085321.1 macro domain-containing protein [Deltaproteobacteria bacterium]